MSWATFIRLTAFSPAPAAVRSVRWDDWSFFNLLATLPETPGDDLPRSPLLGLGGQGTVEGAFLTLMARRERDPRVQASALVSKSGETAGWALCSPDPVGSAA